MDKRRHFHLDLIGNSAQWNVLCQFVVLSRNVLADVVDVRLEEERFQVDGDRIAL